jgi:hypothetical protein
MKQYVSKATYWLLGALLLSAAVLTAGIIITSIPCGDPEWQIMLIGAGAFFTFLFLLLYLAEKSRFLLISMEEINLPRGSEKSGKTVFQRLTVRFDQIASFSAKLHTGDEVISKGCYFYTLKLKDSTEIVFTLYHYGKNAEKDITKTIESNIK